MRSTRMAGCIVLLLLAVVFTGARPVPGPPVVHAEVPDCPLALRARIHGRVLLRVTIDKEGKVTASAVEHGVPFATQCSELAAKKWLFAPSDRDEAREARLSFLFLAERQETDEPGHALSSFDDPWSVRLAYAQSTTAWLPRENGIIPEKRCPVHGKVMAIEVVSAQYGLPMGHTVGEGSPEEQRKQAEREAYGDAREKLFPQTHRYVSGGCIVHEPKAEVYYCRSCRVAEEAWLVSHPEWNPDEE